MIFVDRGNIFGFSEDKVYKIHCFTTVSIDVFLINTVANCEG